MVLNQHESAELQHIIQQRIVFLRVLVEENIATASDKSSLHSDNKLHTVIAVPVEQHVIQQSKLEIVDLNHAMQRLLEGKATHCEKCGCVIPFQRLKTVPVTDFCLACLDDSSSQSNEIIN